MNEKHELRKRMKEILSRISSSDFDNWNHSLSENLTKLFKNEIVISENAVIGGFAPIQREPIWMMGAGKKTLAFPAFEKEMLFKISSFETLEKRRDFGVDILSPKPTAIVVVPEVLLIPGLSFSKKGERLGRGKGFYDRYLETFNGIKVGLCFECQLQDEIPVETHDKKMNFIVTERNIYRI